MGIKDQKKLAYFGKIFAYHLSKWMEEHGTTQKDFCKEAQVSENMVTAWKNGKRYPHESTLNRICQVLHFSPLVFDPGHMLDIEKQWTENTLVQNRSDELQRYAKRQRLDNDFYNFIINQPDFLRRFPFHKRDRFWNNPSMNNAPETKKLGNVQFELVKYQFEDDYGHRVMMTEADIDFLVKIQNHSAATIRSLMILEQEKIDKRLANETMEYMLRHLDIDRKEVLKRINEIDLVSGRTSINEKLVRDIIIGIAKEKGIKPHFTEAEIRSTFIRDDPQEAEMMRKWNRLHGASEEEIAQMEAEAKEEMKRSNEASLAKFRELGMLVDDNTEGK